MEGFSDPVTSLSTNMLHNFITQNPTLYRDLACDRNEQFLKSGCQLIQMLFSKTFLVA